MKNRKLVLSTNNINKIKEMKYILKDLNLEVLSKADINLENFDIIEDGNSLEENSIKKARGLKEKTPYMVMADDSGLFVDELDGEPGVYSSRYAGEEGNSKKNNEKLLLKMKNLPLEKRKASFLTVIALISEDNEIISVEGECKGHIALEARGSKNFGYDPLFIPDGYGESFGQLDEEIKNKISHRARALDKIKDTLEDLLKDD